MTTSNRLSWVIAVLGLWQLITPFIFGYSIFALPLWNAVIVGALLILFGVWSALTTNAGTARVLDWINFILGLWLVVSPFVLGFTLLPIALWDAIIVGAIVAVLAIWAALSVRAPAQPPIR